MLIVHLLGHAHVTLDQQPVPLSAKAVALISYLAIEKLPQHRERLADLLWNTAEARKNLRVELARIRAAGLNIFPSSRQLLYLEHITTDFELWQAGLNRDMNQAELMSCLAMLRGLPLSGLEDLGSSTFQEWVEQQRWMLSEQVEQRLGAAYRRFAQQGETWATRMIATRAQALGLENPAELDLDTVLAKDVPLGAGPARTEALLSASVPPRKLDVSAGPLHFERVHEAAALQHAVERSAERPQLVALHGAPGSGKSYLVERQFQSGEWLTIPVSGGQSGRLVLACIARTLIQHSEPDIAEVLSRMLLVPASLDEDMVKVASALARPKRPVAVLLDQAQNAPAELAPLVAFLYDTPPQGARLFVLMSREQGAQVPFIRSLLRRTDRERCLSLDLPPLSQTSVLRALQLQLPGQSAEQLGAYAGRLLQRSGGNALHLRSLIEEDGGEQDGRSVTLPQVVREAHESEIDDWPAPLYEGMRRLSVINGIFDKALARAAVGDSVADSVDGLLATALERGILLEAEVDGALRLPHLKPLQEVERGEPRYLFRSENLRVTLAGRLPQLVRQNVRGRLVHALSESEPGLALYYAERAGLGAEAERLRRARRERLDPDSPLLTPPTPLRRRNAASSVAEPPRALTFEQVPVLRHGYSVALDDSGWLNVLSSGRYGHPRTLRLQLDLPYNVRVLSSEVRLVWRLDIFNGGQELGPARAPFPLRLRALGTEGAHVFMPHVSTGFVEDDIHHHNHAEIGVGYWMEHRLKLSVAEAAARILELSVRAVDVSLTIGLLSWNGYKLLPLQAQTEQVSSFG